MAVSTVPKMGTIGIFPCPDVSIGSIRGGTDCTPTFVFTEYFSDFSALEQGYFCGGHIEFFSHPYVRNLERPP